MSRRLFTPFILGGLPLPSRIVMAPMTRARSAQPGNVPTALMAQYYAQRASAGLIITEATQISAGAQGYSFTPGVHSEAQITGWRQVTDAVHAAGGRIFLQIWHVGRVSHPVFHDGDQPVAPSAIQPQGTQVWVADEHGVGAMVDSPQPRALTVDEIAGIVADFRSAARNAITAGFDGVEIHGANGYLIDQFLRSNSNQRTDEYGGSPQKRLRFLQEVVGAVTDEIGPQRVGIRLAPFITFKDMDDPQIVDTILLAAEWLDGKLAYIHLSEADWDDAPQIPDDFRHALRQHFGGAIVVAGRYDEQRAEHVLEAGWADLVAFGRPFVANPDLPARLLHGWPQAALEPATLFGGDAAGYTSYPAYQGEHA
ncbi:N-ethylmaleimide reductase [Andreprevotia lacus DSM 23236]|jgi:N-ethylmaleimide reductase|uniref:N-ethylmaleimide reductase n=1 Tax=Andreprevotia lacus DSM 23236 TaxID=1121001 RepID=A0A1W1X472_9NEIS|nr:alkene reductase [Andreprevotia lacus]SMC18677.1 N-ethylmaleimide reductase [Andreprevotia lacus DSM 23236]